MTSPPTPGEEGWFVPRPGVRATIRVTGHDSAGAYSVVEWEHGSSTPGPLLHVHDGEEEAFLVLDGELLVTAGDRQVELGQGDYAMVPRGTPHTFAPVGDAPVRFLILLSPSGYEQFFVDLGKATAAGTLPVTAETMAAVGAAHRMRLVAPDGA